MTRELFPRDHAEDDEDDLTLPDPSRVRSEVPAAPGPDLTPSLTEEVEPPPGTEDDDPAAG
ncbi:hypothetical protein VSH64_19975 [Amycolatopsis rhabdoformis]|uniref:Uncharacterized protein n=1 Tax=Amycolatopsis rhabdoformis TaxID=1448059 RepID=A0ABZ1IJI0_9PSEU|nr:hypothetical protein [Amycolatopsis rhabdoformis]WSE34344.1 hypothetical protein VSH64_19975 [Amycolatopsis rhabdoformis]